ncbi:MAG: hypothetical protein AAB495_00070 [Patescibacteria group bacterium]
MSTKRKLFLLSIFLISLGGGGFYFVYAVAGPGSQSPGSGSGSFLIDTSANIIIGTTTNPGDTRLLVAATSTGASSTIYSIRIIDAGNTSIFNVRNDGRVTIATATFPPTASTTRLRVGGSIESTTGGFIFPDGTTQTTAAASGTTVTATGTSAGAFGANTGGGNYTFPASVGVGIAPSYALYVVGSGAGVPVMGIRNTSASGYPRPEYIDNTGTTQLYMGYNNSSVESRINSVNSKPLRILTNSLNAIYVDASQRVGIGTTTLSNKLSVAGDIKVQNWTQLGGKPSIITDVADDFFVIRQDSSSGPDIEWQINGPATVGFRVYNRTSDSTILDVLTTGELVMYSHRITGISTPTGSSDVATKGYVDTALATSSVSFAGYTSTTFNGSLGGLKGGNQKCQNDYPGSVWASIDNIRLLGSRYPWSVAIWVQAVSSIDPSRFCLNWTDTGTFSAVQLAGNGAINTGVGCSTPTYLACVYVRTEKTF